MDDAPAPNPKRITLALDAKGLYGPEVDIACGAQEPDVDRWETGELVPTAEQLVKLAALTEVPVGFFFGEDPPQLGRVFICDRSRRKHGLTVIEADGTVSVDPPPPRRRTTTEADMPARRPAHSRPVAPGQRPTRTPRHAFHPDPDVPPDFNNRQYCLTCHCHGQPGDARHHTDEETAQRATDQRQLDQRRLGERD